MACDLLMALLPQLKNSRNQGLTTLYRRGSGCIWSSAPKNNLIFG